MPWYGEGRRSDCALPWRACTRYSIQQCLLFARVIRLITTPAPPAAFIAHCRPRDVQVNETRDSGSAGDSDRTSPDCQSSSYSLVVCYVECRPAPTMHFVDESRVHRAHSMFLRGANRSRRKMHDRKMTTHSSLAGKETGPSEEFRVRPCCLSTSLFDPSFSSLHFHRQ